MLIWALPATPRPSRRATILHSIWHLLCSRVPRIKKMISSMSEFTTERQRPQRSGKLFQSQGKGGSRFRMACRLHIVWLQLEKSDERRLLIETPADGAGGWSRFREKRTDNNCSLKRQITPSGKPHGRCSAATLHETAHHLTVNRGGGHFELRNVMNRFRKPSEPHLHANSCPLLPHQSALADSHKTPAGKFPLFAVTQHPFSRPATKEKLSGKTPSVTPQFGSPLQCKHLHCSSQVQLRQDRTTHPTVRAPR